MSFGDFIKREGDLLIYGPNEYGGLAGKPFRAMGVNYSHYARAGMLRNVSKEGETHYPLNDEGEVDDLMDTLELLGAGALRFYTVCYRKPGDEDGAPRFFKAPGVPNEMVFEWFRRFLDKCEEKNVRVIVVLTCQYGFFGGIPEQVAYRYPDRYHPVGRVVPGEWEEWGERLEKIVNPLFYTDRRIIDDFKACISTLIDWYGEHKAVMAWETGNELRDVPVSWTNEITGFIKQKDPNHLIMDGHWNNEFSGAPGMAPSSLDCPHVDIVQTHFYPWVIPQEEWNGVLDRNLDGAKGRKAYMVGEFGFGEGGHMGDFMRYVAESRAVGALVWDLVPHQRAGGFIQENYSSQGVCEWRGYRYPGFPSGGGFWEAEVLDHLRNSAYKVKGVIVPSKPAPKPPLLLPIIESAAINWRGSAGAETYDVYRARSAEGPWELIGADARDSWDVKTPDQTCCFSDTETKQGVKYYYRVTAKNASGVSDPSNIVESGL